MCTCIHFSDGSHLDIKNDTYLEPLNLEVTYDKNNVTGENIADYCSGDSPLGLPVLCEMHTSLGAIPFLTCFFEAHKCFRVADEPKTVYFSNCVVRITTD